MDNSSNTLGVSTSKLDKLMVDVIDYAEKSKRITNAIEMLIRETREYYVSSEADLFRSKFEQLVPTINTVNQNILVYNDDLLKLKGNYSKLEVEATELINEAQRQVRQKENMKEEL